MSKFTSNYSNDWNRYSSDSSPENGKEKQIKYLKKYSKMAKSALDKEELIRLFNKYNYNDDKIENEIKKKLKSIQEVGNENEWVEIKKRKKYSTIENTDTPNRYQHRKSSSYRKQYNPNYDYNKTIPGSSYRGYYSNNNYKYRGGGYKTQRRPFQECIEVPSDPVLFNKASEKNMDNSKKEEQKTGPVRLISTEIKDKKEEKKDESQYNEINISNINKEGTLSLGEEEEIENGNEEEVEEEEEEEEEMTQEEKNKWRKYYLNKLKSYSNTKKLNASNPNKKATQKNINSQGFTTSMSSLTISSSGFTIQNESSFGIMASYDNPNREYMLSTKKFIYPMMNPIMQPIPFTIMMRPLSYPPYPDPNSQENLNK